jgi:hypothetical protein
MRELASLGLVALLFGLGAFYADRDVPAFALGNLVVATVCLLGAAALALRRPNRGGASAAARRMALVRFAWVGIALLVAYTGERAAARTGLVWDTTADERFSLAPATRDALAALPDTVSATLFHDAQDNRARSTRLLLETLAEAGPLQVRERTFDEASEEADRYGIGSSNTIVFELGDRFEVVDRPTEGAIYEALLLLGTAHDAVLYVGRGEGEGRLDQTDDAGYSGLAAALDAEGYLLRDLVMPAVTAIPDDASALLLVAPRRAFRDTTLAAIEAYLARGGRLIALLEPGDETGLETLLTRWGFDLPNAVVVDPASGPVEGDPPGVNPIVFQFGSHPVMRGFGPTQMLFFRRARPVLPARKPEPQDEMYGLAYSSRRAWLALNVAEVQRGLAPKRPADTVEDYFALVAAGRYPREPGDARIVVFGDSDFASNRYLRALYNSDVMLNAVHWAAAREPAITMRPRTITPDQFPLTPQQSLRMLYGVGLLVPELCLAAAALTWARRRSA